MPDPIQPVAAQIQPPNPNQGIQALSGILGIQQQQQGLQLGQQAIAGGAANLQQTQQRNRELSGLQQFAMNALKDPKYLNSDGTLNTTKFQQDATAIAPVYGPSMIGQITQNATGAIENRKALLGLSNEQRQTAGSYMGAVAQDPNASSESFLDAMDKARDVSDDPAYRRAIDRAIMGAPKDAQGIRNYARNLAVATGAPSAAASAPAVQPYNAPGNVLGVMQTSPNSPLGVGPVGGAVQGVGPAQQPAMMAAQAAATTAASGAGGIDNQVFGNVVSAGTKASSITDLAGKVKELAGQIRTGRFTQEFADQLTVLKQHDPQATMRQVIEKYANNLKTTVEGAGSTDQERQQIGSGFPTPSTMNPEALEEAANYAIGQGRLAQERAANAVNHIQRNGSTQGFAVNDSAFMKGKSPLGYAPKSQPQTQGGPVRVKSVEEARALPKGTHFLTPDGREKVR